MEVESAPLQRVRVFDAFRHADFRLLWSGQVVSLIGDAAFLTALGWRAFTLVGSSKLGIVFVAQAVGLLTTLLIGGALADRIPRRSMMIASDLSRCAVVAALALVDASGHLTFELLVALTFLTASATASSSPRSEGSCRSSSSRPRSRPRTACSASRAGAR